MTLSGTSTIASGAYAGTYVVEIKSVWRVAAVHLGAVRLRQSARIPARPVRRGRRERELPVPVLPQYEYRPDRIQPDRPVQRRSPEQSADVGGRRFARGDERGRGRQRQDADAVDHDQRPHVRGRHENRRVQLAGLVEPGEHARHQGFRVRLLLRFPAEGLDFYNRYAETIYPFTDAYGFAYSDRITGGRAAISWNAQAATPIDTVEITILADDVPAYAVAPNAVNVVEYYNASLDHYFITWVPSEIAKLDAGTAIKGWARTGRTFKAFATPQPGTTPVCRYYIPPASGNSHFFGRDPAECIATAAKNPSSSRKI